MRMLFILLFFLPIYTYSQDSSAIVHEIDSIWSIRIKKTVGKKIKSPYDSIRYQVSFVKKTTEIVRIMETHHPVSDEKTKYWIYNYHFRNGKLIYLTKYNNTDRRSPLRRVCYYYFRDDSLVYKHEFRTSVSDIENERKKAYDLKQQFAAQIL